RKIVQRIGKEADVIVVLGEHLLKRGIENMVSERKGGLNTKAQVFVFQVGMQAAQQLGFGRFSGNNFLVVSVVSGVDLIIPVHIGKNRHSRKDLSLLVQSQRSEERRVGKESGERGWPEGESA